MTVSNTASPAAPSWWAQNAASSGEADPMIASSDGESTDLGFSDLVDVVNPLHHIPIVGNLYRALTGDTISETSRMAGGAIWGGPFGVVAALANTITARETGQDIGDTALAWFDGEPAGESGATETALADATTDDSPTESAAQLVAGEPRDQEVVTEELFRFAAAGPSAVVETNALQAPQVAAAAAAPAFTGSKAARLDAFIRQASAVRTPGETAQASTPVTVSRFQSSAAAQALDTAAKTGVEATTESPAVQGKTDVAQWMMRALDKYENMRGYNQS